MFYEKSCYWKFCNIYMKTPVLESLFNKIADQACNFIKKIPKQLFFWEYCEIFKNTYFGEHLQTVAFVHWFCDIFRGNQRQQEYFLTSSSTSWNTFVGILFVNWCILSLCANHVTCVLVYTCLLVQFITVDDKSSKVINPSK